MLPRGWFLEHPRALRSVGPCRELTLGRLAAQHRAPCPEAAVRAHVRLSAARGGVARGPAGQARPRHPAGRPQPRGRQAGLRPGLDRGAGVRRREARRHSREGGRERRLRRRAAGPVCRAGRLHRLVGRGRRRARGVAAASREDGY